MNYSEEQLRAARLAAPSEALDQRMREAFDGASRKQISPDRAVTWRWIGAFAATGIAAILTVVAIWPRTMPVNPTSTQVLCNIEPHGPMRKLLLDSPSGDRPPPHFSVSVTTQ
jgi:hypothetical protein